MRRTLRQMADSGFLNAAGFPPAKKPPVAGKPPNAQGAAPAPNPAAKLPTGNTGNQGLAPELHIHLHPDAGDDNMDPSMSDPSEQDPSEDPSDQDPSDMDPSDTEQTPGSPLAQHIAQNMQDPLGATKKTFGNLTKTKLAYNQAQEEAKRAIIPVQSVLQHVSNAHQLTPAMPGMSDPNNPDAAMGYDQQGNPQNMQQQPGAQQMQDPQNARMAPGASPTIPGGAPGAAGTRSQRQVVPPKMGVPEPGQGNAGTRAGNPSSQPKKKGAAAGKGAAGGKSVKVEVHGASDYRRGSRKLSKLEAAASLHNLRF